ncbi:scarecrow-like protein 3 [Miscanthus floridulus]|uniref:scarecrow-like protein 3 n=1 Tax=Miscanthus floridulus TaxID=154761 RepID=UPI00345829D2
MTYTKHGVLGLRFGEARMVVCMLQLHYLLAATNPTSTFSAGHRFNRTVSVLRLQQMVSTSCPSSGNDDSDNSPTTPLGFISQPFEALGYYTAVYDSLGTAATERAEVECAVLGEEIRDVRLHEGDHRRERHDRLQQTYVGMRQGNDVLDRCSLSGCAVSVS